jgi:predicted MFS family arabinose efflux permease
MSDEQMGAMKTPPPSTMYRAVAARDAAFDGIFVNRAETTGIYCPPSCGPRLAEPSNIRFSSDNNTPALAAETSVEPTILGPQGTLRARFGLLWTGQTVSIIGSQFSSLSIQMIAAIALRATPTQMGFLTASQTLPYLVLSLFIGVLVDRVPKKSLLIMADGVRGIVLVAAAALLAFGQMTIWTLCSIVCTVSLFTLIFDAALGAAIPELFRPNERITVNSRLNMTLAGSDVVGPTLSGFALRLVGITGAMLFDSVTYFISAFCIYFGIGTKALERPGASAAADRSGVLESVAEGILFVARNSTLRALGIGSAIWNFSWSAVLAVLVLHALQDLKLTAVQIGLAFAAGGLGGIAGSLLGWRLARSFPQGKILVLTPLIGIAGGALLLLPGASNAFVLLAAALFLYNLGESTFGVNMQTTRQAVTPMGLMGRMDTAMRFCFKGMASLGAITGGLVASRFGVSAAVFLGVSGLTLTFLFFLGSNLYRFDTIND